MVRFKQWTALAGATALLMTGCSAGSAEEGGGKLDWGRCKATADGSDYGASSSG